ncbi:hypothetical protein GWI33_008399 [Rhynchophorus ferrugineus]|uniref:Uncharacterized protein n=1 Tax=Rhynchophorus ferrugineus TaxID=354439 RepID=A0A834IIJ1_RHYFE|nr:hypothetical protein GWI33_008399 [Rhynchophorus ferrugineus]
MGGTGAVMVSAIGSKVTQSLNEGVEGGPLVEKGREEEDVFGRMFIYLKDEQRRCGGNWRARKKTRVETFGTADAVCVNRITTALKRRATRGKATTIATRSTRREPSTSEPTEKSRTTRKESRSRVGGARSRHVTALRLGETDGRARGPSIEPPARRGGGQKKHRPDTQRSRAAFLRWWWKTRLGRGVPEVCARQKCDVVWSRTPSSVAVVVVVDSAFFPPGRCAQFVVARKESADNASREVAPAKRGPPPPHHPRRPSYDPRPPTPPLRVLPPRGWSRDPSAKIRGRTVKESRCYRISPAEL